MMAGTFTLDRSSIGTIIDTNCQIRTITFLSPVSVPEPVAYEPVANGRPISGTFCIADNASYQKFNWNFDVLGNAGMPRGTAIPMTPAVPPSTKTIAQLTCLSCPIGASFSVTTA
jgi:hypothetical protein